MADQRSYNHNFNYTSQQNEYTFRLRKKRKGWWWLLLLLLLPLLLIRCQHDITITVLDDKTKEPIPGITVKTRYTSHILLQDGMFVSHKNNEFEDETDAEGKVVMKDVKCCLFSYIFYAGSDITITADDAVTVEKAYHYTRNVIIEIPGKVTLRFRTIDEEFGNLIPRCDLEISTTESGVKIPTSSGTGEFEVSGLRHDEKISITASKNGYDTNNTTIQNAVVDDLLAGTQDKRDIPLKMNFPKCGNNFSSGNSSFQSYNMGIRKGTAIIEIDAYSVPDHFIIYDGPDKKCKKLFDGSFPNKKNISCDFNNTVISIEVIGESYWNYTPHCP